MANLTTASTLTNNIAKVYSLPYTFPVANTIRIWAGSFVALPGANALTSARGYLSKMQDQVNIQPIGYALAVSWTADLIVATQTNVPANVNSILGNSAPASGVPIPQMSVECGPFILKNAAVAGIASQADVWRTAIYLTTDNYADLTTTAATYAPAVGRPIYWYSGTTCDMYFWGMALRTLTSQTAT